MFSQMLFAQAPAAGAQPQGAWAGIMNLVLIIAIFAVFYFILIRPQQKQQKMLQKKIAELKKGDRVVTAGGIYGEFVGDKEQNKIAIIKIADNDTKIEVVKSSISAVLTPDVKDLK